ncbi:glycoside hydrolase [Wenjunlia vitaminophila]|uniref:alpha-L-fucosidase n=2 Tax=Wenjunlia vitaminophila TaxID=76728 RepID=A0A0T6LPP5_WENVI|nr:glycoside hydrolase [Wenjunlia vitaminophila]
MRSMRTRLSVVIAALGLLAGGVTHAGAAPAASEVPPGSELRNLVFGASSTQSSTDYNGAAARAADGNRYGDFTGGSVTHTSQEAEPYWQTDLGASKRLDKVVVWNRTDCCVDRLSNFWVIASDTPITARSLEEARTRRGVTATRVAALSGPSVEVAFDRSARYLRIQLEGTDYLSLAEVEAFGDEVISPSARAQQWVQDNRFGMFLHYNMSTYVNKQWAEPTASPALFNPDALSPRQWARSMKDAGMTFGVLTAKHHDGFALWDSELSDHDVAASPYKDGNGDVIREYVDAMRAEGLKVGLYFSIWDRHNGDSTKVVQNQLRELLTEYGQIDYLWFDGWGWHVPYSQIPYQPVRDMIRRISPNTVVANNDHRGTLLTTDVIIYEVPVEGMPPATNARPIDASDTMDTNRTWFNTTSTGEPRSTADITDNLAKATAGNALFLLNVGPDKSGRIPQNYVERLKEVGAAS